MQVLATTSDVVSDGAVLAQAVLDARGQLLLPAGASITTDTLRGLHQRGIETVTVALAEAASLADETMSNEALQAQVNKRLKHLFRPALQTNQLNPLFYLLAEYRVKGRQ